MWVSNSTLMGKKTIAKNASRLAINPSVFYFFSVQIGNESKNISQMNLPVCTINQWGKD